MKKRGLQLLLAGLTAITLNTAFAAPSKNVPLEEKTKIEIKTERKLDEATENCYKTLSQFIPKETIRFYSCYSDTVSFNIKGKKVKLCEPDELDKYFSMVDPKSRRIRKIVEDIQTENRTTIEIAEDVYDILMYKYKIRYKSDPDVSPLDPWISDVDCKDYVRHGDQTLEDRCGDCEDLSILFMSCLLSKKVPAAMIIIPRHVFNLVQIKDSELSKLSERDFARVVVDEKGNSWIPIDISGIGTINFDMSLQDGKECFHFFYNGYAKTIVEKTDQSFFRIIIPQQYRNLFGY